MPSDENHVRPEIRVEPAPGRFDPVTRRILGTLVGLKIVFLFLLAWHSRFVMDEFAQLGWAKYLGNGLFDTVWHPKAVGYVIFYKLAHLLGWDATSILLIGRVQTALLACATLALVYGCARALGNDRLRSLAIVLILLCFSNFIERSFRTIAEPLAVFFAVAALLVLVRAGADRARTITGAGILVGLSFLATQKAIYFAVALGIALVADAALARRYVEGIKRGIWLVLGWLIPIVAYCLIFGGTDPMPIAKNLFFGPIEVATTGGDVYPDLRKYVWQTLQLNALLYILCFAGMALASAKFARSNEPTRIALIFSTVVTALVFAHNQPWPYVFVMALPFVALWSLGLFDRVADNRLHLGIVSLVLGTAVAVSFGRNIQYLRIDNPRQLELVARAEALLEPDERYFDGIAMLPNRMEPSTLWLDRAYVQKTLRDREGSEAYRILSKNPPKIILWSYRMDRIYPVVAPLIRDSYVQVAPNLRVAGRPLLFARPVRFNNRQPGSYALYSAAGEPLQGMVEVNGRVLESPFRLDQGWATITLRTGRQPALLLPQGSYAGHIKPGRDDDQLFAKVYD